MIAIFVMIAGLSPLVWLIEPIVTTLTGGIPSSLDSCTTDITAILDAGIITPACFLAGISLLRRKPIGYFLSSTLLILLVLIGLIIIAQTMMQLLDGVVLSTAEIIAFVVPFVSLSLVAIGMNVSLLRNIKEPKIV